jgi:NADPH-dependent curcumin reductase CurA
VGERRALMLSREIRLASRPTAWPALDNFSLGAVEVTPPLPGQVRVRNLFMSVDPYMRGRMNDAKSYVPPFQIGQTLDGAAVGEVVDAAAEGIKPGDIVTSNLGWREYFVAVADAVHVVDPGVKPLSAYLGVLGIPGFTAWAGLALFDIAAGERILVSAAAGAVGSIAGQLAKLRGCFVVGSAGSPEKVEWLLHDLGFDAAINYREGDLLRQLRAAAPEGIDVYFDNVGGPHLEAALSALRLHGRVIACGAIAQYNDEAPPPGPRNLAFVVTKRLTIKGFIVIDWFAKRPDFEREVGGLYAAGKLKYRETVVEGIENAPRAFLELLRGGNIGKMVVKLA